MITTDAIREVVFRMNPELPLPESEPLPVTNPEPVPVLVAMTPLVRLNEMVALSSELC